MIISKTLAYKFETNKVLKETVYSKHINNHINKVDDFDNILENSGKTIDDYFYEAKNIIINSFNNSNIFLVRKTVQEIANKIKIDEEKSFDYLIRIPDGDYVFILSDKYFYRIQKENNKVIVFSLLEENNYMNYTMFNFNLLVKQSIFESDDFTNKVLKDFLQISIFWQFTTPDIVIVRPKSKMGTRNNEKTLNDTPFKITIIDSTWNKVVIRTEGFDVSGHLRLQAIGKGKMDRKLVWINPYRKNGYIRKNTN